MSASAGGGRSGWASSDDYTAISLVIILIATAFGAWLLWTHHHTEVVQVVATLQLWKMALIARFTAEYADLARLVARTNYATVTLVELAAMTDRVSAFFRVPVAALIAVLGAVCLLWAPPTRYRRKLDLDGLAREQARFFRSASAALGRGLKLVPIADGPPRPADPALDVLEWTARFATGADGEFDPKLAEASLRLQLGPVWRGAAAATPAARVMFAAFALHLAGRREEVFGLLGDLAVALAADNAHGPAGPQTPLAMPAAVLSAADEFIAQPQCTGPAEAIAQRHAFQTTALMALLTKARLDSGVLAPAQFSGLKLLDRNLWYALHALGFPGHGPGQNTHLNPRVEAVGARAHWDAERLAKCALFQPELAAAVGAVRATLIQHRAELEEQP